MCILSAHYVHIMCIFCAYYGLTMCVSCACHVYVMCMLCDINDKLTLYIIVTIQLTIHGLVSLKSSPIADNWIYNWDGIGMELLSAF